MLHYYSNQREELEVAKPAVWQKSALFREKPFFMAGPTRIYATGKEALHLK
jgi:hypothetical protein